MTGRISVLAGGVKQGHAGQSPIAFEETPARLRGRVGHRARPCRPRPCRRAREAGRRIRQGGHGASTTEAHVGHPRRAGWSHDAWHDGGRRGDDRGATRGGRREGVGAPPGPHGLAHGRRAGQRLGQIGRRFIDTPARAGRPAGDRDGHRIVSRVTTTRSHSASCAGHARAGRASRRTAQLAERAHERDERDVEEQQDAHEDDGDEDDERPEGAHEVGQRGSEQVAQRASALLEVRLAASLAAEEVDEPLATDEDDQPTESDGDPAVVDIGRAFDEHASDDEEHAEQPGTLAEEWAQEAVDVAVEEAATRQEERDERDGADGQEDDRHHRPQRRRRDDGRALRGAPRATAARAPRRGAPLRGQGVRSPR